MLGCDSACHHRSRRSGRLTPGLGEQQLFGCKLGVAGNRSGPGASRPSRKALLGGKRPMSLQIRDEVDPQY